MQLHDCSQPWFELQINYHSGTGCCCYYKGQPQQLDFSRPIDMDSIWNGPGIQNIRRVIAHGRSEGIGCDGCQWLRYSSAPQFLEEMSHLKPSLDGELSPIARNWKRAKENYLARANVVDSYPVKYYFNFGLACNIRCIMCSQTHMRKADRNLLPVKPLIDISPYLAMADQIHVIGGEPLIIPTAQEFLEHMFSTQAYSQTMLSLYTNATLLDRYMDRFQALARINICASLDSTEQGYEFIRRGASWKQTEKNLLDFKELGTRLGLQWQVTVACILMKSSIATLDTFVEWCACHDIPCHFAPISYIDVAENEDIFRFPALLDQVPGWEQKFERAIAIMHKKGWIIGRGESLQVMLQELQTASNTFHSNQRIRQMVHVAISNGISVEKEFKAYITKAQTLAELGQFDRLKVFCDQTERILVKPEMPCTAPSPAEAYWNQRHFLAARLDRLKSFIAAVGHRTDLDTYQWVQIFAYVLEYKPDLIIELGRGKGNSTCLFTEAANILGGRDSCQVASICLSDGFATETLKCLFEERLIGKTWLAPLDCWQGNILGFDYKALLHGKSRVLVFWDAHGYEVASCVLGHILPQLIDREHMVIMHDLSDQRYLPADTLDYHNERLWSGNNWEGPRLVLDTINSAVEQAVAISDFSARNGFNVLSADHSNHTEIAPFPEKMQEMQMLLGDFFFQLQGHWFCFSLNRHKGPITFPRHEISDVAGMREPVELLGKLALRQEEINHGISDLVPTPPK